MQTKFEKKIGLVYAPALCFSFGSTLRSERLDWRTKTIHYCIAYCPVSHAKKWSLRHSTDLPWYCKKKANTIMGVKYRNFEYQTSCQSCPF